MMNSLTKKLQHFSFLPKLVGFVAKLDWRVYLFGIFSTLLSFVDLYAMSWLLPFSTSFTDTSLPALAWYHLWLVSLLHLTPSLKLFLGMFLSFFLLKLVATIYANYLLVFISKRAQHALSSSIFTKVVSATQIKTVEKYSMGYFVSLGGDDCARSAQILLLFFTSISLLINALLYYLYLSYLSMPVFVGVNIFFCSSALFMYFVYKRVYINGALSLDVGRRAASVYIEGLNNIRTVRALCAEPYVSGLYKHYQSDYLQRQGTAEFLSGSGKLFPMAVLFLICLGSFSFWDAEAGSASFIAKLLLLVTVSARLFVLVGQAMNGLSRLIGEANSCKDIVGWLDSKALDGVAVAAVAAPTQETSICDITIRNVSFSHSAGKGEILKRVNLRFERGRRYAIVGPSGGGKSTLLDLLAGTYTDYEGEILLNGASMRDAPRSMTRGKILLLNQTPGVFNTSIRDNILMGMNGADDEQILDACGRAQILQHVNGLAAGLDDVIKYQGTDFSGGQRQRLALSRIFIRNPDVVLLDEATSALDKATSLAVMTNIQEFCKDRILIFVTHHEELLKFADEIIHIDG